MRVYRASCRELVIPPNLFQQTITAEGLAGMGQKIFKQLKFFGGKLKRLSSTHHPAAAHVDINVAKGVILTTFGGSLAAAKNSFDSGQQLANRKRLGYVIVGAEFEANNLVHFLTSRGQHDDGQRRAFGLELLANIEPTHPGHHDVEYKNVRGIFERTLQAIHAVSSGNYL